MAPAAPDTAQPLAAADQAAPDATVPQVNPDQKLDSQATTPDTSTDQTAEAPKPPASDQMFITQQGADENLASTWIGKTVYNSNDENLGDINDILLAADGSAQAVILGVGGFLGIGEKNVAVAFSAIEPRTNENGKMVLYLNATKDQLDAAPEFVTLAAAQAAAKQPEPPAPAAPEPAPAPAPAQ